MGIAGSVIDMGLVLEYDYDERGANATVAFQDDIVVGTPIAGRQRSELETLIGLFLNTLVMRADVSADPTFNDLLAQVQTSAMDAFAHQDLPFEKLVEELAPERDMSYSPVFQVLFMLQNAPHSEEPVPGLQFGPVALDYGMAKFDITMALTEGK